MGQKQGSNSSGSPGRPNTPGMEPLFAPWRMSYMDMLNASERDASAPGEPGKHGVTPGAAAPVVKGSCFLRDYWLNPALDERNHVVVRTGTEATGRGGLIMLNKYPYANGHLLVCLGDGRPRLLDYTEAQRTELWSLTDLAVELVEKTLRPQGVNVGMNQGVAAGAGVPEHVHVHVVPRWAGDVNFVSVCSNIRVIPSALEDMARRFREVWGEIKRH